MRFKYKTEYNTVVGTIIGLNLGHNSSPVMIDYDYSLLSYYRYYIMVKVFLGLNFSHNPSAALIKDGNLLCAFEEEKFMGIKGYNRFPWLSIMKAMEFIPSIKVLHVSVGFKNLKDPLVSHRNLSRIADRKDFFFYFFDLMQLFLPYKDLTTKTLPIHLKYILNRRLKCNIVLKCFDHHDSHAASAIYGLNWENGVCVTLDGWGDGFSSSFSVIQNGKLTPLARVDCLDSIGTLYNRVTKALGFKSNRHEGKVMGLAAYGNSYQVCQKFQSITDGSILGVSKFGVSDLTDSQVYKKL